MATVVKMPQLGESVVEGTVARWLKQPGDRVTKREPLLEISTDKIDTEVPAPADGVLLEIVAAAGVTVKAGAPLGYIGAADEASRPAGEVAAASSAPAAGSTDAEPHRQRSPRQPQSRSDRPGGRDFISPVVARMAAEHAIDLAQIAGTGLGGRITRRDVELHMATQPARSALPAAEEPAPPAVDLELGDVLTPLTTMRRAIAQHMVMSKQTSPHVTSFFEVDMTAVVRHREAHKRHFAEKGIALTYTAYFLAAIVAGLKEVPMANARYTDAGIIVHRRIHLGVAVSLRDGLVVPVLRDADEKNLQGLARALNDLVEQARGGSLAPDDLRGGTFTLTNHGTGGSLFATPIINQPQTGILGVGAIVKRPVVRTTSASLLPSVEDALVIRPMCYLSFSIDHRVLDGAQADAFLTAVKRRLENWV
jgi:2-oxoisovalerate dehydrogenase E2 component (dihydrolipoyl transacylase)